MKKLLYVVMIIALIIAGVCVAAKISEGDKTIKADADAISNTNKITEKNEVEGNNIVIESENNVVENNEAANKETSDLEPEEQAKQLAKDNWGEDDTVYFCYEEKNEEGRYVISVRDKATTKALEWFYIDIETGTIDMK